MMRLEIARTTIDLNCNGKCNYLRLPVFVKSEGEDADLTISHEILHEFPNKRLIYSEKDLFFWYEVPAGYRLEVYYPKANSPYAALEADRDWQHAVLYGAEERESCLFEGVLGEVLFRNSIIRRGGLQIHSAAISYNSESILFSAPSGTGKTTQARLWMKHFGASMIQGDRPAMLVQNTEAFACGTPWVGSDPMFENTCQPVRAIVFIEQASANEVKRLSSKEAICLLAPRCFLPYFSKEMMQESMNVIENLIKIVPCFLLKCTPEKESAELLHSFLEN